MTSINIQSKQSSRTGFTLVEIMIVVVIIGLLAAMAIPAFQKVRIQSNASRIANDFRDFNGAFETHALAVGSWPEEGIGNNVPESMEPYLENTAWYEPASNGGYWDWEVNRFGVTAAVALSEGGGLNPAVYIAVDNLIDDGDLSTVVFRQNGNRYFYILEL